MEFDPTQLGAVPVDAFDPTSLGAVPVDKFDPASIGAVPVNNSISAGQQVTATPSVAGDLSQGNLLGAAGLAYENVRRHFSGLIGPTESERIANSVPVTDANGNTSFQYKPEGSRLDQEQGLFTPYLKTQPLQPSASDSTLQAAGKAIFNIAQGALGSIESPGGVATFGTSGAAAKATGAAFGVDMLSNVKEQVQNANKATTTQGKVEGYLGAAVSLAMAGLGLRHAFSSPTKTEIVQHIQSVPDEVLQPAATDLKDSSPQVADAAQQELARRSGQTRQEIQPALQTLPGPTQEKVQAILEKQSTGGDLSADERATLIQVSDLATKLKSGQSAAEFTSPIESPPALTPATAEAANSTSDIPAGSPPVEGGRSSLFSQAKAEIEPQEIVPETANAAGTNMDDLRSQLSGILDIPKEEPSFDKDAVEAHASKLPKTAGQVVTDVLGNGKTVEEAAAKHGISVAKAQDIVDRSSNFLKQSKTISPLSARSYEDEAAPQGRQDNPEVEQLKDWTSATEEPAQSAKMKRGSGEAGAIEIPKFADRKMSELDQATTERSAKLQKSFDEATRAQNEINKAVPDAKRQNAISVWIEAGGDASKLADWETNAKGDVFKRAAKDAQTLTPEEITIAQKAKGAFDVLAQRGQKFDVLKNGRENYVPHVWDVEKSKGAGSARLQDNFKFAKARTFENFAEGDAAGFKPKTLQIGKLLPAYLHEMNKVIADRQFVQDLSKGTAEDGRPLATPRGRISDIDTESGGKAYLANPRAMKGLTDKAGDEMDTKDYRTLENQPALHDWRWEGKDTQGNPIFMKDDLALHPDAAKRLTSILGKSAIREWYNEPSTGGVVIAKAIARGLDTAQSVMKREMFGLLAPFHQVQEGWHGVAHRVNPLFDVPKVDLRDPAQMDAAKHGLMMLPDRASSQSYVEGLGGKGTFLTQALRFFGESKAGENVVGKAATTIANVVDGYQNYLFHQYIPGLKFKTYEAMRGRNMDLYSKELKSGRLNESDVKLLSAEQTNAAYGHLNLALLDRNPTMQHLMQLSLLAPDFLEARARFVGQATKGLLGSKVGAEQFKAIATIAAVQAASAYVLTKLGGDEWDATHPFEVVHGGRRYTLRSVPEDIASLLSDPRQFLYSRVNPLTTKGGIQMATGLNYRGEKTTSLQTVEELLAQYIPITARSVPGIRSLTETSRQSPLSPLEQLAGSLGVRVSRKSPITDTYKTASDWMEKQGIEKDKGSYPVSKFQQLRYALEDGDLDRAGKEYDKLLPGTTKAKLSAAFHASVNHPFTKSSQMDAQFSKSLTPKDRSVFDLAQSKRKQILSSFSSLHSAGK